MCRFPISDHILFIFKNINWFPLIMLCLVCLSTYMGARTCLCQNIALYWLTEYFLHSTMTLTKRFVWICKCLVFYFKEMIQGLSEKSTSTLHHHYYHQHRHRHQYHHISLSLIPLYLSHYQFFCISHFSSHFIPSTQPSFTIWHAIPSTIFPFSSHFLIFF